MICNTIIIGAGQAGLSLGYYLAKQRRNFLILDSAVAVGNSWRNRYDSLVLFTPSQYNSLPGFLFPAPFDTYPTKNQVADYLACYADKYRLPIQLNTRATRISRRGAEFVIETTQGVLSARQIVVATGTLHKPFVPAYATNLPATTLQLHSFAYRNPQQLQPGNVLVVGAGNSGTQIAMELARERHVHLAVGKRPLCLPQRFLGRDIFWWIIRLGMMDSTAGSWPWGRNIRASNPILGISLNDLHQNKHLALTARVLAVCEDKIHFCDGACRRFANVIWATGYRYDFTWIDLPILDSKGRLMHQRGTTPVPGLYFLGLQWLHTGGSGFLGFVGRDAQHLATQIV